jgi:hypothetical protein
VWRVHIPPERTAQIMCWKGSSDERIAYLARIITDATAWRLLPDARHGPPILTPTVSVDYDE